MTSELFSSVYKEKSDHLFDDRIFSCPLPAFTHWSIFVPLSENPYGSRVFGHIFDLVRTVMHSAFHRISLAKRKTIICIIPPSIRQDSTARTTKTNLTAETADKNRTRAPRRSPYHPILSGTVGDGLVPPANTKGDFLPKVPLKIPKY